MLNSRRALSDVLLIGCAVSAAVAVHAQQRPDSQRIADNRIDKQKQIAIALSDDIWRYSEPLFQEFRTVERISPSSS